MPDRKTAIITGASGGIGAGLVDGFLNQNYNVVGTSLNTSQSLAASPRLVLVDGDITQRETAVQVTAAAIKHFGSIDVLVNDAGIFFTKPFLDFTTEDFHKFVSINLLGFLHMTQLTVTQMLQQGYGSVVTITASLADRPISGENGSVPMMTKGGLNAATRNLAIEFANRGIRFNAVAPGAVDTSMHKAAPSNAVATAPPARPLVSVKNIVDAVLYLAQADHVSGEILHVDGWGTELLSRTRQPRPWTFQFLAS